MRPRKRDGLFLFVAAAVALWVLFFSIELVRSRLSAWPIKGHMKGYSFMAMPGEDGRSIDVSVSVDFSTESTIRRYARLCRSKAKKLASDPSARDVPVLITFDHPLNVQFVRGLESRCRMHVEQFVVVGRARKGSTERGCSILLQPLDSLTDDDVMSDVALGQDEVLSHSGIIFAKGTVEDSEGLGCLLAEPDVYVLDTSEWEIRRLLEEKYPKEIAGKDLNFELKTPFWRLKW